ncbi:MAG: type II toxin-antitoxin system RelE/ParE family toxin [Clostridia bacterium]|nr:type II toxin-antitoxin system RelE/ParE family toxin [Clostridia bacterium]
MDERMTYHVVLAGQAKRDIRGIYDYISTRFGYPETARNQCQRILDGMETLAYLPEKYDLVSFEPARSRGVRRLNVDNYAVFYMIDEDTVVIVGVKYAAADLPKRV